MLHILHLVYEWDSVFRGEEKIRCWEDIEAEISELDRPNMSNCSTDYTWMIELLPLRHKVTQKKKSDVKWKVGKIIISVIL